MCVYYCSWLYELLLYFTPFSRLQDYENQEEVPNKKIKEEPPEERSDENLSMKEKLKKIAAEEKRNKKKTFQVISFQGIQISLMIPSTYVGFFFLLFVISFALMQELKNIKEIGKITFTSIYHCHELIYWYSNDLLLDVLIHISCYILQFTLWQLLIKDFYGIFTSYISVNNVYWSIREFYRSKITWKRGASCWTVVGYFCCIRIKNKIRKVLVQSHKQNVRVMHWMLSLIHSKLAIKIHTKTTTKDVNKNICKTKESLKYICPIFIAIFNGKFGRDFFGINHQIIRG